VSDTNNNENWLFSVRNFLRPSKTIPSTSWRADTTWGLINGNQSLQRFLILIFGLTLFGIGEAFLVITSLGNSPWVVLSEGISLNSNLNIGQATFFVSLMVLFFWIPLKQKPGFGTLANMVVIAAAIELGLLIIPEVNNLALKVFYVLFGILLVGIGSALYITCGLGTGPRDGLMTGLHYRTGVRVGRVRLGIEVVALTTGALLGGSLGVGTALFALLIGQSVAISLGVLGRLTSK
jgi:uncharacterized membrane protein YczE